MEQNSQFALLKQRRFFPFFLTQSLGAFNDNVFKNALLIMVTFGVAGLSATDASLYVNLGQGIFILPFFLFSAFAGQLAEKFDKATLIQWIKVLEIGIMALGLAGFALHNLVLLFAGLFMMGLHSTLFGPVKYAILPQQLQTDELVGGNALVESATFLAILLGTMLGGWLIALPEGGTWTGAACIVFAVLGYLSARGIPHAGASVPDLKVNWNPLTETWRNLQFLKGNRTVLLAAMGNSWFWFYGAIFLAQLPGYAKLYLGGNEHVVTVLLTVFSLGIGAGSLLCERLSGHKIEIGLVPFGSIGLTLLGIDLYFANPDVSIVQNQDAWAFLQNPHHYHVLIDLLLIGVFGGFYIVPLYAMIQTRSEPTHRSRIIAGTNILNALFMVASALVAILLLKAGLTIPQLLLTVALMNAAVTAYIYTLVPEFLMRFMVWLLINVLYRIDTRGLNNIPDEGPALVVCNHVSFVDAVIVGGSIRRPVRFVTYHKIYRLPVLNFIFRTARAIPIAPAKEDEALLKKAYEEIDAALRAGEVVGLFPEGGLTPDGEIQPFKPGIERILARTPVPVVPMALRNLWSSMWSRRDSRLGRARMPRRFRAHIELIADTAIPAEAATPNALQQQVLGLRGEHR